MNFKKGILSFDIEEGIKMIKKCFYPVSLIFLFIILITAVIPDGCVYGSNTDWLSQHVTLAETIRNTCREQNTLLPSWIGLGSGSSGYQFAYYGFLRPDILLGCLLPGISMASILIWYMTTVYLVSVLLTYCWLRAEKISRLNAWFGSVLFMTAGCLFHMHRQIMFVNYLPFLLLAFLCIRKKYFKWLPLCMLLICLSSFYFAVSAFAAVGWYWYTTDRNGFWRNSFLKRYIPSVFLAAAMAAALLLPTALVLLEHHRNSSDTGFFKLLELFGPNPVFNNILFNEYGMGLTLICFYAILAGLRMKTHRQNSLLFLLFGMFGIFSYILNGTLYARPKILIPFMPLVILHCVRMIKIYRKLCPPLWPFAVMLPVSLLWFSQKQFPWIILDLCLLFGLCLAVRMKRQTVRSAPAAAVHLTACILLAAPIGMYLTTSATEDWVKEADIAPGFSTEELKQAGFDPHYHFDSLLSPLISGNELSSSLDRSTMYSSVTNGQYSELYYETLMTPVRINNRVALLTSDNPFMLSLLSVRYLETASDHIPAGYKTLLQSGGNVIAENPEVLPTVYFTDDAVSEEWFDTFNPYQKLDIITRKTVVNDDSRITAENENLSVNAASNMRPYDPELQLHNLPEGLVINRTDSGWEIKAEKDCSITLDITDPHPGNIVLCQFDVKNLTGGAVIIDINNIRNKLSGAFAPYPNGNRQFHYQFSTDSDTGVNRLKITFSKGHYRLEHVQWHLYDQSLLNKKEYTPLTGSPGIGSAGILNCRENGYLVTSIPKQNGFEILVDGKPSEIIRINQAFAGTYVEKGRHTVEFRFTPPGKRCGCIVSVTAISVYVIFLLYKRRNRL